jgi:hypothetical protein
VRNVLINQAWHDFTNSVTAFDPGSPANTSFETERILELGLPPELP